MSNVYSLTLIWLWFNRRTLGYPLLNVDARKTRIKYAGDSFVRFVRLSLHTHTGGQAALESNWAARQRLFRSRLDPPPKSRLLAVDRARAFLFVRQPASPPVRRYHYRHRIAAVYVRVCVD